VQEPLYMQLYKTLKDDIVKNYQVGDKLPSIRKVAELNNISKTTVESAYNQLYAEGYIESRPKSGYFVSDFNISVANLKDFKESIEVNKNSYKYDFFPAQLNGKDFPIKVWKRVHNRVLNSDIDFGSYGDGQGEVELREQIASYLNNFRGASCRASEIVITHGFSDSLSLVAKLLKDRSNTFAIEHPGYHVPRRVFGEYGYKIKKIDVLEDGLDLDKLKKSGAKIVYITPSHQYPTGVIMPISNRLKLIKYMQNIGGYILEDDYDSELKYRSRPIPSLQGLGEDVVVYFGTFAKILSPAIRVGYVVLPRSLVSSFKTSYEAHFAAVCKVTQKSLAIFMKDGHFDRHLRKIRKINRQKHDLLLKLLKEYLNDSYKVVASGGGLAVLIMPKVDFDFEKFKNLAVNSGIKLYFAKERSGGEFEAIRLGFGGFEVDKLEEAVKCLAKIWHKSLL